MQWYFYIGLIASICISVFTLPQLLSIIKTRNTAFINIPMYSIYLIGCFCFLLGGIFMAAGVTVTASLSGGLPLIIAQSVCGIISSIIFIWKLHNKFAAQRLGITEAQFCEKAKKQYDAKHHKGGK